MTKIKDIKQDPANEGLDEQNNSEGTTETRSEEFTDTEKTDQHPEFWTDVAREEVLHIFTDAEKILLGQEIVDAINVLAANESAAKAEAAEWKGVIKINKAAVDRIKRALEEGQEVKYVDTEIKYNYPKRGWKQVIRQDNREVLREVEMTTEELQLPLYRAKLDLNKDTKEAIPGFDEENQDSQQKEDAGDMSLVDKLSS